MMCFKFWEKKRKIIIQKYKIKKNQKVKTD